MANMDQRLITEFQIPMPWGHVAAKAWGSDKNPLILCFHGVLDNAGSFNRLIPCLPDSFYYVCIDLPGHGRSSHFPPHLPISSIDNLIVFILITQYFKKERYTILAHSYGGQLSIMFAQLYPDIIEKLIIIDILYFFPQSPKAFQRYMKENFETYLHIDKKQQTAKPPEYTYEEALEKVRTQRPSKLMSREAAAALLERNIQLKESGKYIFTLDQRLKNVRSPLHDLRYQMETLKMHPLKCPTLILLAKKSLFKQYFFKPLLEVFEKMWSVNVVYVEGEHDVHNIHPEIVSDYISKFLVNKNKL